MAWEDLIGSYSLQYVPQAVLDKMASSHTLGISGSTPILAYTYGPG